MKPPPKNDRVHEMAVYLRSEIVKLMAAKGAPFVEFALIVFDRYGPGGCATYASSIEGNPGKLVRKMVFEHAANDRDVWPEGDTFTADQLDAAADRILDAANGKNAFFCQTALALAYSHFCVDHAHVSLEKAKEFIEAAWGAVLSTKE
jgi:hypothetical protein